MLLKRHVDITFVSKIIIVENQAMRENATEKKRVWSRVVITENTSAHFLAMLILTPS